MLKNSFQLFNLSLVIYLVLFIGLYSPVLSVPVIAKEEPKIKIAVLDFKAKNVPETDAAIITDLFRDQLFNTKKFQMLDKAAIDNVIKKFNYQAAGICDVECAINIGENLQADKVINGDVNKLGAKYLISIRMVDVTDATLQLTKVFEKECRLEDLTLEMPGIISKFVEEYTNSIENNEILSEPLKNQTSETPRSIKGKLKITVAPDGATVIANDKLMGISPFGEKELEAGAYKITARKAGYEPKETTVSILNGKTEEIKIELKPIEAQSGVIADKGGSAPEEDEGGGGTLWWILGGAAVVATAVVLASGSSSEPPVTETGTLEVKNQTSSTVSIFIDSVSQGTIAPNGTQSYTLDVGTYTLKITSGDSSSLLQAASSLNLSSTNRNQKLNPKNGKSSSRSSKSLSSSDRRLTSFSATYPVSISAGQTFTITHKDTSWSYGDLRINSTPTGAEIWLNGIKQTETTNAILNDVVKGNHNITLKLNGFNDFSTSVEVSIGRTTRVDYDFSVAPGKINIASNPTGAQIKLDGNETGKATPALLENVNPGSHKITLTLGGYDPVDRIVEVKSNETASINVNLSEQTGNIQVTSTPDGASVWLDAADQGKTTPVTLYNVTTGPHTVTCKKSGYSDASQAVNVQANKTASATLTLTVICGSINVTSNPAGATVWLDGVNMNVVTPTTIDNVNPGSHEVICKKCGYNDASQTVNVNYGQTTNVDLSLSKISCISDLMADSMWNIPTLKRGDPNGILAIIHNNGPDATDIRIMFYLSSDTSLSAEDILLECSNCDKGVVQSGDNTNSTEYIITAPVSTPPGTYWILLYGKSRTYGCYDCVNNNDTIAAQITVTN